MFYMDIKYIQNTFEKRLIMDYKEMYLKMMHASEDAIRILTKAQQECEEMYVSTEEPEQAELEVKADSCEWICYAQAIFKLAA